MRLKYYIPSDKLESLRAPEHLKKELEDYCLDLYLSFEVTKRFDVVDIDELTLELSYQGYEFNLIDLSRSDYFILLKRCNDYICDNISYILEKFEDADEEERYQKDDFI